MIKTEFKPLLFHEDTLPTAFLDRSLSRVPAADLKETKDAIHLKL